MDYKIKNINEIEFFSTLHDCVINKVNCDDNKIVFSIWDNYLANDNPKYLLEVPLNEDIDDCVSIYSYKFVNGGHIEGKIEENNILFDEKFKLQIIDIGYMYNTVFLKGSKIDAENKLSGSYVIIEISINENFERLELKNIKGE